MRMISFALTTEQFLAGTKDVTRRTRWLKLKPGDRLMAVRKAMGLKKGEKVVRLGPIEVVSVRREPLWVITPEDVVREGFPGMTTAQFMDMFVEANGLRGPRIYVTRIEFKRLPWEGK